MTPEQLREQIARGELAPVYLFTGGESRLKHEAVAAIVASVPEGTRALNAQVFHAFEADRLEVLTAARTLPFLAPRRVVVLRDVEKIRPPDWLGKFLDDYLPAPAAETTLVLTTEDGDKAKGLVKRYQEGWEVVTFRPLAGTALAGALRAEAARLGCAIDAAAAAELAAVTGDDQGRAFNELEKLRSAVGAGGTIDPAAVARYAAGYAHHGMFDIVDAIGRRDLEGSLRLLAEVTLKDEEFLPLLGLLGKRLRTLWFLAAPEREVPRAFNVAGWQLDKLRRDARGLSRADVERGLEALVRLDEAVKSTAVPPRLLVEHFLLGWLPVR